MADQLPHQFGKYTLEKFLGGGMSHVYRATDSVIGRTVAVKILTEQGCADPEAKARFLQEARMAGNIQHDNIINIYDFGEEAGRPFMVMEYLVGQDLRDAIKNGQTGDFDNKLRIGIQIARALEYTHSKRIIHRDIKPENIHLDANGRAKLMDFGIAKAEGMSMTKAGFALGTPYYMAPEQVLGEHVGEPADVYAFGILMFELLTGVKPMVGDTVERLFYMILNEPVDLAPLHQAGVPEPVSAFIAKSTEKKAADRYQNFTEVAAVLESFLKKSEPLVVPEGPKRASGKLVVAVVGGLMAVIAGGLILVNRPTTHMLAPMLETQSGQMYLVSGGRFLHGPNKETAIVPDFYMDRYEVSNADYAKFASATSRPLPDKFPGANSLPVTNVTIADATAYAKWAGKRLPDALEWEKAARGSEGQTYPWGNEADASRANVLDNASGPHALLPVDSMPKGASPYRVQNLIGNAFEYVRDDITPSQAAIAHFSQVLNPPPAHNEPWYSVKGGSFNRPIAEAVPWEWTAVPARFTSPDFGFRCVKDPPK